MSRSILDLARKQREQHVAEEAAPAPKKQPKPPQGGQGKPNKKANYRPWARGRKPHGTQYVFSFDEPSQKWTGTLSVPGQPPITLIFGAVRFLWDKLDNAYDEKNNVPQHGNQAAAGS